GPPPDGNRSERHYVVLHDRVGPEIVEDLAEAFVRVGRAVDQRLPRRLEERLELLDRRLAELGGRVADEVLPELARVLLDLGRGGEAHSSLLEPTGLERAGEGLLNDENHAMPSRSQDVADTHAVVGRAERAFREEHDRLAVLAHVSSS